MMSIDNNMSNWPYPMEDDQDQQGDQSAPRWYEDDRDYRLKRLQDRMDTHVAGMMGLDAFAALPIDSVIATAIRIIREIDKAAQQEVDRDE